MIASQLAWPALLASETWVRVTARRHSSPVKTPFLPTIRLCLRSPVTLIRRTVRRRLCLPAVLIPMSRSDPAEM
jgi:hypothetical protein